MRLWTVHPRYLDARGLVALWREGLLARAVLQGRTVGYRHHPQLERFRAHPDPVAALNTYLLSVHEEGVRRGYRFDASKLGRRRSRRRLVETAGQLAWEWGHLKNKLEVRSPVHYREVLRAGAPRAHPLFVIRPGPIREWERAAHTFLEQAGGAMPDSPTHGRFEDILKGAGPEQRAICAAVRRAIASLHRARVEVTWPRQKIASYGVGPRKMTEHYAYIGVQASHVNLGFYHGASLEDPAGLLEGTGKKLRHVKLRSPSDVKRPAVKALLRAAIRDRQTRAARA